jgi:hypothetical protein
MDGLSDRSGLQDDEDQNQKSWLDELRSRIENLEFLIKNRNKN